jgi:hypothetical protein
MRVQDVMLVDRMTHRDDLVRGRREIVPSFSS